MMMANKKKTAAAIISCLFCMAAVISAAAAAAASNADRSMRPAGSSGETPVCNGTIGECGADGEEYYFPMEPEISRRFLQAGGHISYDVVLIADRRGCNQGAGNRYGVRCFPTASNTQHRPCSSYYDHCRH